MILGGHHPARRLLMVAKAQVGTTATTMVQTTAHDFFQGVNIITTRWNQESPQATEYESSL